MEQQTKITKSKARHLRRKKLNIARRAAESHIATENNEEIVNGIKNKSLENEKNVSSEKHIIVPDSQTAIKRHDLGQVSNSHLKLENKNLPRETKHSDQIINQELLYLFTNTRETNLKSDYSDDFFSTLEDIAAKLNSIPIACSEKVPEKKMNSEEKSREQIKAEREAKKAAKLAAKNKNKEKTVDAKCSSSTVAKETSNEKLQSTDSNAISKETKLKSKETKVIPKELKSLKESSAKSNLESIKSELDDITNELDKIQFGKSDTTPPNKEILKVSEEKSKAQLRAERRARQEAQRAAKQEQGDKKKQNPTQAKVATTQLKVSEPVKKITPKSVTTKDSSHGVNLFKHLHHERDIALGNVSDLGSKIHPEIVKLGVKYANKIIVGSNARCVAFLQAVKHLVEDFERPSQADFTRGLEVSLQESSVYLDHCRPSAVSMQNALKHLKWQMSLLPATISDQEAKVKLINAIDTYIQEQILLADKAISIKIQTKITNGDVILTYGFSSLIHKILCDAQSAGRQFQVVVVDGRPWLEGKEMLKRLVKHGIECSYILIHALSFIMPKVSKVFLGAHAILANGSVMSRAGSAQVALIAKAFNVPVLVSCETHKSCERAQTDAIVYNELGDSEALTETFLCDSRKSCLANWKTKKSLNLLNITYDVTPADLVTAVVTELAILPPSSVPVILRIKPSEI
ncbi:translation initiation factor eIF-2B subunit delta [Leptopilina boulardi]|uniref:translation initiation factor eIF-2B subunit delta n=1 Tax=Leptopilina boulardi TaxID=63433 RepID=UPI0021F50988|nr:translation initiation factor eIF-2B subunit delta [Leptopilina boulardi]XP_051156272.1 translation initiation factor eIF-2B subunit delta [Leptopilina boulardi]